MEEFNSACAPTDATLDRPVRKRITKCGEKKKIPLLPKLENSHLTHSLSNPPEGDVSSDTGRMARKGNTKSWKTSNRGGDVRKKREGGAQRLDKIDQQKDFAALAVSGRRGEARRKNTASNYTPIMPRGQWRD